MVTREGLALDIGSSYIKALFGSRQRIKLCGLIKTPEKSVMDNNLVETEQLRDVINAFINENKIKPSYVSYAIHGQEIVIRHIEVPNMDERGLRKAVEWEITQYLPENGASYYIDYEIIDKFNTKEKKGYSLLVVAAPKAKINKYAELSFALGIKLKSIDIASNCIARVYRSTNKDIPKEVTTGIIDIGYKNMNCMILEGGKLFMERELPIGVKNAVMEISKGFNINDDEAYTYLFNKFDFGKIKEEIEGEKRVHALFENILSSFESVIQFYTTGKTQKSLDKIYIIGGGSEIPGIDVYISDYLNSPASTPNNSSSEALRFKFPQGLDFKVYANALGLLLRKE